MLSLLRPRLMLSSVYDVDLRRLHRGGIRGVILDLDNTLTTWKGEQPEASLVTWLRRLRRHGLKAVILSNNSATRVRGFARRAGVPFVADARKPFSKQFRTAMELLETEPTQTAVIGDQVFTDIFGGNRLGLYTILVLPVADQEFVGTRAIRRVERAVLHHFGRQGLELPVAARR